MAGVYWENLSSGKIPCSFLYLNLYLICIYSALLMQDFIINALDFYIIQEYISFIKDTFTFYGV